MFPENRFVLEKPYIQPFGDVKIVFDFNKSKTPTFVTICDPAIGNMA